MGCGSSTPQPEHPEPKENPDGPRPSEREAQQQAQIHELQQQLQQRDQENQGEQKQERREPDRQPRQRHPTDQDPQDAYVQRARQMEADRQDMEQRREKSWQLFKEREQPVIQQQQERAQELQRAAEQRRQKKRQRLQNVEQFLEQERQEAQRRRQEDEQHFPAVHNRPVANCGVRLSWLLHWAREAVLPVLPELGESVKTGEVCQKIVIPQTEAQACRFVDILDSKHVGSPDFFVSHTWGEQFYDLIKLLERRFESAHSREFTFVWLDILAINQHRYKSKEKLTPDDVENLEQTLKTVQKTILCLDWSGSTIKRIWCLFECWKSICLKGVENIEIQVMDLPESMPKGSKLLDLTMKQLAKFFDIETQAMASREDDRLHILAEIEKDVGCRQLSELIKDSLVTCVALEAEDALDDYVLWEEHQHQQKMPRFSDEDMALVHRVVRALRKMSVVIECVDAKKNKDQAVKAYELSKKNTELCYKWFGDSKETVDALRMQGRLSQHVGDVSDIKEYQRLTALATDMAMRNVNSKIAAL